MIGKTLRTPWLPPHGEKCLASKILQVTDIIICQPVWGDHVLIKPNIVFLLVRVYGIF